jgi:hypothetical protein
MAMRIHELRLFHTLKGTCATEGDLQIVPIRLALPRLMRKAT